MKLYRVVKNPFSNNNRIEENHCTNLESLYYQLGYIYYLEENKEFFLTKEDSIQIGYQRLKEMDDLDSFYQLEYDIPVSLIINDLKKIEKPYETLILEIKKDNFEKLPCMIKNTKQISKKEIEKILLTMFRETLLLAKKEKNKDYEWYKNYCNKNYESFSFLLTDDKVQRKVLKRSKFDITKEGILFLTNYRTNNCLLKTKKEKTKEEDEFFRRNILRYTKKKEKLLEYLTKIEE